MKLFDVLKSDFFSDEFLDKLLPMYPKTVVEKGDKLVINLPKWCTNKHLKINIADNTAVVSANKNTKNSRTGVKSTYNYVYRLSVPEGSTVEREFKNGKLTLKIV